MLYSGEGVGVVGEEFVNIEGRASGTSLTLPVFQLSLFERGLVRNKQDSEDKQEMGKGWPHTGFPASFVILEGLG